MIFRKIIRHPVRLIAGAIAVLLAVAVVGLGYLTIGHERRIEHIRDRYRHSASLETFTSRLQDRLIQNLTADAEPVPVVPDELRLELLRFEGLQHSNPQTRAQLRDLALLLAPERPLDAESTVRALSLLRRIVDGEMRAQARALEEIQGEAAFERDLAFAILIALAALILITAWLVRRWILRPLGDLRGLLTQLAEGDFQAVSTQQVDPILIPLFENYNDMVNRLEALEAEHRERAESLRAEVRGATEALLEQHRSLANAERLAVAGEMAAGLAHELRNPLAGMALTLGNLRREAGDADIVERLDLVIAEVERVTRLLNGYLSSARHAPEPLRKVNVHELVADLLTLVGYQAPATVRLRTIVDGDIECNLPRDRIRQMLLNLVLNSVEALDGRPGTVTVSAQHRNKHLILSVLDDGPGFPDDLLGLKIRAFTSYREAGTGLGLVMIRRGVAELGGELEIENQEPHGALVRLILPCNHG